MAISSVFLTQVPHFGVGLARDSFHLLPQIFLVVSGQRSRELEGPTRGGLVLLSALRQDQLDTGCP